MRKALFLINHNMLFLFIFIIYIPCEAYGWSATTERVVDGDTIVVSDAKGHLVTIRIYGIDCPEGKQAYGDEATAITAQAVNGQRLEIEEIGPDVHRRRTVAIVHLEDGSTLQDRILEAGFAWVAPRYCKRQECEAWQRMQDTAIRERKGLWQGESPVPPWLFRKR